MVDSVDFIQKFTLATFSNSLHVQGEKFSVRGFMNGHKIVDEAPAPKSAE